MFALQGGATSAAAGLDVFGILVVALVAALGGGVLRDVLIGDVPPDAFRSTVYLVVAFGGGAVATLMFGLVRELPRCCSGRSMRTRAIIAARTASGVSVGGVEAEPHRAAAMRTLTWRARRSRSGRRRPCAPP